MRHFVISWCCEGLETVQEIQDPDQERMWLALQDKKPSNEVARMVFLMTMRARANTQRHYEIYAINTEDGITKEDMEQMFEENPQYAADLIRERGTKIYSDRARPGQVKIT
jgi:hypothetical protein